VVAGEDRESGGRSGARTPVSDIEFAKACRDLEIFVGWVRILKGTAVSGTPLISSNSGPSEAGIQEIVKRNAEMLNCDLWGLLEDTAIKGLCTFIKVCMRLAADDAIRRTETYPNLIPTVERKLRR